MRLQLYMFSYKSTSCSVIVLCSCPITMLHFSKKVRWLQTYGIHLIPTTWIKTSCPQKLLVMMQSKILMSPLQKISAHRTRTCRFINEASRPVAVILKSNRRKASIKDTTENGWRSRTCCKCNKYFKGCNILFVLKKSETLFDLDTHRRRWAPGSMLASDSCFSSIGRRVCAEFLSTAFH